MRISSSRRSAGHLDDPRTSASRPGARAGAARHAPVIRSVSSAARIDRVSGQRRYTVGRLTPARRAISASVTRSTPKSRTQLAAARQDPVADVHRTRRY